VTAAEKYVAAAYLVVFVAEREPEREREQAGVS
jgi:hypothetical protein